MMWVFWVSLAGLVYIYVGYPVLIWAVARLRPRPIVGGGDSELTMSVVIAAFNEGPVLKMKVGSLLASSAADRIVEILIASDASTDDTVEIVEGLMRREARVRLLAFDERRGKPACLNDAVEQATGDLLIMTDARQEVAPDALERLTSSFGDPTVGVVSGELIFRPEGTHSATGSGMGAYWEYEKFLRRHEALVHSVPGATGALYAIRRHLFRPIPEDTLIDDVVVPMQAVEQDYRCVFEVGAEVYDHVSRTAEQENRRKRRTLTGCVQLLTRYPRWCVPGAFPIWWQLLSHKIARLASPLLLILLLISSFLLRRESVCAWVLLGQLILYALALVAWLAARVGRPSRRWSVFLLFVELNGVILGALWDGVRGRYRARWKEE